MENINLIRKIAWSFYKSTGIDYKELFAEASLWYCEAERTYDPNKGVALSYWAWRVMQKKLSDFAGVEKVRRMSGIYTSGAVSIKASYNAIIAGEKNELDIDSLKMDNPEVLLCYQPESFEDFFNLLPKDCQKIVEIIFDSLKEIEVDSPKLARGKIISLLRENGWGWPKIWSGMKQMQIIMTN